jgi:hypothetical protein
LKQPLSVYLHDHLAGATYALDLVDALQKNHANADLGEFAARLHQEISADKQTLHEIAVHFGPVSDPVKDMAAWLSEKVSRIKLNHSGSASLATFEALEFLRLGINGKTALWQALAQVAPQFRLLSGIDFAHLQERARRQGEEVERYRLEFAKRVFTPQGDSPGAAKSNLHRVEARLGSARANSETRSLRVTDNAGHDIENPS